MTDEEFLEIKDFIQVPFENFHKKWDEMSPEMRDKAVKAHNIKNCVEHLVNLDITPDQYKELYAENEQARHKSTRTDKS